jgi:hypothetical protein
MLTTSLLLSLLVAAAVTIAGLMHMSPTRPRVVLVRAQERAGVKRPPLAATRGSKGRRLEGVSMFCIMLHAASLMRQAKEG